MPAPLSRHDTAHTATTPARTTPADARRVVAARANNSSSDGGAGTSGTSGGDSDAAFVVKMVAASFAGGALIKYGSLAADLPFEASAPAALALVLGPPLVYSAYLLAFKQGGGGAAR